MVGVLGFFAYFSRAFDVSFREGIMHHPGKPSVPFY